MVNVGDDVPADSKIHHGEVVWYFDVGSGFIKARGNLNDIYYTTTPDTNLGPFTINWNDPHVDDAATGVTVLSLSPGDILYDASVVIKTQFGSTTHPDAIHVGLRTDNDVMVYPLPGGPSTAAFSTSVSVTSLTDGHNGLGWFTNGGGGCLLPYYCDTATDLRITVVPVSGTLTAGVLAVTLRVGHQG